MQRHREARTFQGSRGTVGTILRYYTHDVLNFVPQTDETPLPASPEPTAKSINSRKREEVAGGGGDDEARKAQRMARNRRAAATSRARKKEHLESLQAQVDRLLSENAALRRRLSDAGLSTADGGGGAAEDPGAAKGSGGPGGDAHEAADAELGLGVGLVA